MKFIALMNLQVYNIQTKFIFNKLSENRIMDTEQSKIINIAVAIFQNVGIKRYIGSIEALMHQDIYFEIYKIIFPDSMINIFKISDSSLSTGEKIQKVINEISSIIGLELYHIQGQEIAQGNMNHLANWLQLLEALSARCFPVPDSDTYGSAPDCRDHYQDVDFNNHKFHTVIGINKEFQEHEKGQSIGDQHYQNIDIVYDDDPDNQGPDTQTSSGQTSEQSKLKPVCTVYKNQKQKKRQKVKKVTFNLGGQNRRSLNRKYNKTNGNVYKGTKTNNSQSTNYSQPLKNKSIKQMYGNNDKKREGKDKILKKKVKYISKMHRIIEEIEKSKINEQNIDFRDWMIENNQNALEDHLKIEDQNRIRTQLINFKINERDKVVDALVGQKQAYKEIKKLFKKQKQAQKINKHSYIDQMKRQADMLMDQNFAEDLQEYIMLGLRE